MNEELLEHGIVIGSENGIAKIRIPENESCHSCGAKMFCNSDKSGKEKIAIVKDNYNTMPGTKVTISLPGKNILMLSILLYGIPIIIFSGILAIFYTFNVFSSNPELYSFLSASGATGIYYLAVSLFLRRISGKNYMPEIVFVNN